MHFLFFKRSTNTLLPQNSEPQAGQHPFTRKLKLAGEPGRAVAVAVEAFGLDSVPSAICAVAVKLCAPDFSGSAALVAVMPVTAVLAPAGAGIEKTFTGVPVVTS